MTHYNTNSNNFFFPKVDPVKGRITRGSPDNPSHRERLDHKLLPDSLFSLLQYGIYYNFYGLLKKDMFVDSGGSTEKCAKYNVTLWLPRLSCSLVHVVHVESSSLDCWPSVWGD